MAHVFPNHKHVQHTYVHGIQHTYAHGIRACAPVQPLLPQLAKKASSYSPAIVTTRAAAGYFVGLPSPNTVAQSAVLLFAVAAAAAVALTTLVVGPNTACFTKSKNQSGCPPQSAKPGMQWSCTQAIHLSDLGFKHPFERHLSSRLFKVARCTEPTAPHVVSSHELQATTERPFVPDNIHYAVASCSLILTY